MLRKSHFAALLTALAITVSCGAQARTFLSEVAGFANKEVANSTAPAAPVREFVGGTAYSLCFVPDGPSCERMLVESINATRKGLLIQAYSFTSATIAKAVVDAHRRGVEVYVILDKSQESEKYTSATFLRNEGVPVVIDRRPAIAHNKVMIFDGQSVFTGSFNFTRSAQDRNAENGIIIRGDAALVKSFTDNWNKRYKIASAG